MKYIMDLVVGIVVLPLFLAYVLLIVPLCLVTGVGLAILGEDLD